MPISFNDVIGRPLYNYFSPLWLKDADIMPEETRLSFQKKLETLIIKYIQGMPRHEFKRDLERLSQQSKCHMNRLCASISLETRAKKVYDQNIYAILKSLGIDPAKHIYDPENTDDQALHTMRVNFNEENNELTTKYKKRPLYEEESDIKEHTIVITRNQDGAQYKIKDTAYPNINALIQHDFIHILAYQTPFEPRHWMHDQDKAKNEYYKLLLQATNLYDLLERLTSNHHEQCMEILEDLESVGPKTWIYYSGMASIFSCVPLSCFYLIQPGVFMHLAHLAQTLAQQDTDILIETFKLTQNAPLLGIAYQSLLLGLLWWHTLTKSTRVDFAHRVMLGFQTLREALVITGYVLSYLASGICTEAAATYFILGALVDLLQHTYAPLYNLIYQTDNAHETNLADLSGTTYYQHAIQAPYQLYKKTQKTIWHPVFYINFIASALIIGVVVVNYTFPPSFMLTVSCMLASIIINYIKDHSIKWYNSYAIDCRQATLLSLQNQDNLLGRPESATYHGDNEDDTQSIEKTCTSSFYSFFASIFPTSEQRGTIIETEHPHFD